MSWQRVLIVFGVALSLLISESYAQSDHDQRLQPMIQELSAKLEKSMARRPFKFKGMNDSLQLTAQALKFFVLPESPKSVAMSVWPSGSPLTPVVSSSTGIKESQKQALRLLEKALASYPDNSFARALKAYVLYDMGRLTQSRAAWQSFLSRSQDYSSFDREILSRAQLDSVRLFAKDVLHSQGLDFNDMESQRLLHLPVIEKFWYFATHVEPEERALNRAFMVGLFGGAFLFVLCSFARMEFYRVLVVSLVSCYAAVWVSYGCWIYDRAFGLPGDLSLGRVMAVFFTMAAGVSLYEVWTAWRYANPQLEEGYCRCPYCKKIIVQLSVECEHCHKKL